MPNLQTSSAFLFHQQKIIKSKNYLLLLFSLFFLQKVGAAHFVGGEIRWVCLEGSGKYVFYMDIYRECTGTSFLYAKQNLQILNSSLPDIIMKPDCVIFKQYDGGNISPKGPSGCQKVCYNGFGSGSDLGATQFFPFVSDPITLKGVPPSNGWVFYWTNCCRPNNVVNLSNPASQGYGFRAIMYPYEGQNTSTCFDSSPQFEEMPAILACKGYEYIFNHNAYDTDLDSLVFRWAKSLDNSKSGTTFSPNPVVYTTGYSYDKPTPGPSLHPLNQTATLNPKTGEIKLAVFSGMDRWQYATCIQVDAYRCGKKIASVFRDIPFMFFECPLLTGTGLYNNPPVTHIKGVPAANYSVELIAGEFVKIPFQTTEFDIVFDDPNIPGTARAQYSVLEPSGLMFSNNFSDSNDCRILGIGPCATLTPPPVLDTASGRSLLSGQGGLSTMFQWQTDCTHLRTDSNCTSNEYTYNFVMKSFDDFCDIPGINYPSISVTVKAFVPKIKQQGNQLAVEDSSESYKWYYNDTLIPNSDTNAITALGSGKYAVEVVKYGCRSTRTEYNYWHVGTKELESKSNLEVEIFPNPFNKKLTIILKDHLQSGSYNYTLSDMEGRAIKTSISVFEDQKIVLDIAEDIPAGAYILTLFNNEERMIKKLIKY